MTFKKINISSQGQAIFEYFILTTVVVAVVLFFASSDFFKDIKESCQGAFNQGVRIIINNHD